MQYDEKYKEEILEEFKECPYYKTVSREYGIDRETLRRWVRKANIDVETLVKNANKERIIVVTKFKTIKVIEK